MRPKNLGDSPAPELPGLSRKGYPGVTKTPRAAHLSTQVGAFLFKDQGQVVFVVSCKEPINLLQPARDKAGRHSTAGGNDAEVRVTPADTGLQIQPHQPPRLKTSWRSPPPPACTPGGVNQTLSHKGRCPLPSLVLHLTHLVDLPRHPVSLRVRREEGVIWEEDWEGTPGGQLSPCSG